MTIDAQTNYWNEMERKWIVSYPFITSFSYFQAAKIVPVYSKKQIWHMQSSKSESSVELNHLGRPKQVQSDLC